MQGRVQLTIAFRVAAAWQRSGSEVGQALRVGQSFPVSAYGREFKTGIYDFFCAM
jgi:hypothetical protein